MPFIILDRDGVINYDSEFYIKSPEEWHPIPGSLTAIAELNKAGYQVIILTNQSGIARGLYNLSILQEVHNKLIAQVQSAGGQICDIFYCPHHPDEGCVCRKPKPGLFFQIQKKYPLNLKETFFIGDSLTDMQAAAAAGCKPLLVMTGNGQKTLEKNPEMKAHAFDDLAAAAQFVIKSKSR